MIIVAKKLGTRTEAAGDEWDAMTLHGGGGGQNSNLRKVY